MVSNGGRDLGRFVEHFDLSVDAFLTSRVHGKVKPSPCIFLEVLRRLGALPSQAVMVGDSWADDVEGARRVGLKAMLLDRERLHPNRAEAIPSLTHAVSLLLELHRQSRFVGCPPRTC